MTSSADESSDATTRSSAYKSSSGTKISAKGRGGQVK